MANNPPEPAPDSIIVGSRIWVEDLDSGEEFHFCLCTAGSQGSP
jgi:hypothetical protein